MEKLKLTKPISLTNLHLYNKDGIIRKYDTIYQIMDEHFYTRFSMYSKRKEYQLNNLNQEITLLEAKMKFIQNVIDEVIIIYKKSKSSIIEKLKEMEFPFYENNQINDFNNEITITYQYNYLLNMSIYNFTLEKVDELEQEILTKKNEYEILDSKKCNDIWKEEITLFEEKYNLWLKK